jgi:hypothetical protein
VAIQNKIIPVDTRFSAQFFPRLEEKYKVFLAKILTGSNAWKSLVGIIGMLFLSFILLGIFPRKVLFFQKTFQIK